MIRKRRSRHVVDHKARLPLQYLVIFQLVLLRGPSEGQQEEAAHRHVDGEAEEIDKREDGVGPLTDAHQQGHYAEDGVQHADTRKVVDRPEMAHALLCRRVIHPHIDCLDRHTGPGSKHQQLQFGLIARGDQTQSLQLRQRIESEATLCVGQIDARLQAEPEVRETVGKGVLPRHILLGQIATAHDDGLGITLHRLEQQRDVGSEMLSVGIDGHRMGKTHLTGFPETRNESMALTLVLGIGHHGDTGRQRLQLLRRIVGAAVVDHDHLVAVLTDVANHLPDRSSVVIRWNDRTYIATTF